MSVYMTKYYYQFLKKTAFYQLLHILKMDLIKEFFGNFIKKESFNLEGMFDDLYEATGKDVLFLEVKKSILSRFEKPMLDLFASNYKNLSYEIALEFEKIHYFLYLFTEFENYLFQIFKYIIKSHPAIIYDKGIQVGDLEQFANNLSIDIVYDIVAEKVIHDELYKKYSKIFKFAKKKLGLNIEFRNEDLSKLEFYKQIRNLYAHGDGTINMIANRRFNSLGSKPEDLNIKSFSIGEKIIVNQEFIEKFRSCIHIFIETCDKSIVIKYPELKIQTYKKK